MGRRTKIRSEWLHKTERNFYHFTKKRQLLYQLCYSYKILIRRKLIKKKEKKSNKLKTCPYPHFVISFSSFSSIWNSKSPSSTWTPTLALELHGSNIWEKERNVQYETLPGRGHQKSTYAVWSYERLFSTQILIIWKLHYRILTISCTSRISTWVPLLRSRKQSFFSVSFSDRASWPIATRQWTLAKDKVLFHHVGL